MGGMFGAGELTFEKLMNERILFIEGILHSEFCNMKSLICFSCIEFNIDFKYA